MTVANVTLNQILIKRGNTAQVSSYTGPLGELIMDTSTNLVHIQDGTTAGGQPVANIGAYLPTYTGNVQATNIILTGNTGHPTDIGNVVSWARITIGSAAFWTPLYQ